jgi:diaminopimelate epimerase
VSKKAEAISFVKASACGNDFLLIDFPRAECALPDIAALTRRICDRHDGVGADGVEWMRSHPTADVEIRLINADGSEAEISGNGTRCVAAYLFSGRGAEKISIQTGAGLKTCVMTGQGQSEYEYEFEIEMGSAVVEAELAVKLGASEVRGIPVSMGNPHYVVFVQEFVEHWQDEAADIQRAPGFRQGVNVEMVAINGKHDLRARFFERGVGETQSSGTGSCASALAAMATGRAESPVRVHAQGGTQTVRKESNSVFLRGSARLVCRGEFFVD